jgi:Fe-S-cluster containining protein
LKILERYILLPIISSILGLILGIVFPIIIKKIKIIYRKKIDKNVDEFDISGNWTSIFLEEKDFLNESVKITQLGRKVTASIIFDKREYTLEGEFKNQILLAKYESNNPKKDERGSIVLRYINENLLSGYCTFVFNNKQVYNSPYVLVADGAYKPNMGTYQFCNSCVGKFDCCCNCEGIDMPILLPFEAKKISISQKESIDYFANKLTTNLYQMKRVNNDEKNGCIFFQNNKCSIYKERPIDCRLFPFDFKEFDGEYWLIYYDKICNAIPTSEDEIKMCSHCLRPLLDAVSPYLSECSDPIFSKRLKEQHYNKLFPISMIRDDRIDI